MDDLTVPNFTNLFAQAYQTGRQVAQQKGVANALSMAATDPTGAQNEAIRYGDMDTANALGKRAAEAKALKLRETVAPMAASGDFGGARNAALAEGDFDMAGQIGKLDETQRAHALENAQVLAGVGFRLLDVPYEQRKAAILNAAHAPGGLLERGFTPEQVEAFDPTDENIQAMVGSATSLKDQLQFKDKNEDNALQTQRLDELIRHNQAMEGVSGGRLALSRQKEGRVSSGGGGRGGGATGLPVGFQLDK